LPSKRKLPSVRLRPISTLLPVSIFSPGLPMSKVCVASCGPRENS